MIKRSHCLFISIFFIFSLIENNRIHNRNKIHFKMGIVRLIIGGYFICQ